MSRKESNKQSLAKSMSEKPLALKNYKNERNLMLYPFCSTSKRKRISPIDYVSDDGSRWLQVTANNTYGMAKIWDFDILRFVFSKISTIENETGLYPSTVTFTAYECLKALSRDPKAGKNIQWLRDALDRLTGTTYKGNIFKQEANRITAFTLIKYDYIAVSGNIGKIVIALDERLLESIRGANNLLKINEMLIREEAGIKKRLFELVEASIHENNEWKISLNHLQRLCANDWLLSRFKFELTTYNDMPWSIDFHKEIDTHFVVFKKRTLTIDGVS